MAISQDIDGSDSSPTEKSVGVGLRILIVGSDCDSASFLAKLLIANGHNVRVARLENAANAGWIDGCDVVIQDQDLATLARSGATDRLETRANSKRPLVIVVTNDDAEKNASHLREVLSDLRLEKPFNPGFLLRLLTRFQTIINE
jgi:DNA-binding response OmpR family regulator